MHNLCTRKCLPVSFFLFERTGHVASILLEQTRRMNSGVIHNCFFVCLSRNQDTHHRRCITIHHMQESDLMSHPLYSPDLALNYFLSYHVCKKYSEKRSELPKDAVQAFRTHVLEIPRLERQKCNDNWFKRLQKYIDLKGECFVK